jgi:transcriptional regulator with XRE-family HTH domain
VANDICVRLGRRLRKLRTDRGWNQAYLAEISGIDRVHISELENGRREAGLRVLEMLATSFQITLAELMTDL